MRLKSSLYASLAFACAVLTAQGQGAFQNLNFDSTQIPPNTPGGLVPVSEAFPGWSAYLGAEQQTSVYYDSAPSMGRAQISINISGSSGNTAVLRAGVNPVPGPALVSAAVSQTGFIPVTAMSLLFVANQSYGAGWSVTLGGQPVQVVPIANYGFTSEFAANISTYAGKVEELRFSALSGPGPEVNLYFSQISFSPNAVPEPGTFGLFLCGAFLLGIARWRNRLTRARQ